MLKTRVTVAAALAAVATVTALAAVSKVTDKFTSSVLSSSWTTYTDGATTLSPSGGALTAVAAGSGTAAVVIEGYQLASGSWKATVAARQLKSAAALAGGSSMQAFMGLQYGGLVDGDDLSDQANGYLIGVEIYEDAAYAGWSQYEAGFETDGNSVEASTARLLSGAISATYTSTRDRLVIGAGRYKETFAFFMEGSVFSENSNAYLGAGAEGDVSGTMFTFDNFSLSGAGLVAP